MFRTYYAKVGQPMSGGVGGGDRLIAVTGVMQGGLMRVIDVDATGNAVGEPTYLPRNVPQVEMVQGPNGFLVEATEVDESQEINWAAHESSTGRINEDGEVAEEDTIDNDGKVNPALAAFPHLQES